MSINNIKIHPTADVSPKTKIGIGTQIWHQSQIREGVVIGNNCIVGKNVYIDINTQIGNNVKIQNNVSLYNQTIIEDGVFIGPHCVFTNDKNPRAINVDNSIKNGLDWNHGTTIIKQGASIGAQSVILPDITVGEYALVGAGSVVTKNVPEYTLVFGNPAAIKGYVCKCGTKISKEQTCVLCGTCII